jgi:hypothetical protein
VLGFRQVGCSSYRELQNIVGCQLVLGFRLKVGCSSYRELQNIVGCQLVLGFRLKVGCSSYREPPLVELLQ